MPGVHQRINAALAWSLLMRLQAEGLLDAPTEKLAHAIAHARAPGRLECVTWGTRRIWLDAAHNAHALQALLPSFPQLADPLDAIFVFTRADRSLDTALPCLRPFTRRLITRGGDGDAAYDTLEQALEAELAPARHGAFLILGSFTTVAAAHHWLARQRAAPAPS